jgi:hypothetical protein
MLALELRSRAQLGFFYMLPWRSRQEVLSGVQIHYYQSDNIQNGREAINSYLHARTYNMAGTTWGSFSNEKGAVHAHPHELAA